MAIESCPCGCCLAGVLASQPDYLNKILFFWVLGGSLLGHFVPGLPSLCVACLALLFLCSFIYFILLCSNWIDRTFIVQCIAI
ncbi:hypothetical protein AMTRI_Chr03g52870 [Amborella trichopoda]